MERTTGACLCFQTVRLRPVPVQTMKSISSRIASVAILLFCQSASAAPTAIAHLEYQQLAGPKRKLMADTATFFELESYRIKTTRLVEFKADKDKGTLTVTNWIPRDLANLQIVCRNGKTESPFATLDKLPGLEVITLPADKSLLAQEPDFDFIPQNDLQREIKNITVEWELSFYDRYMHSPEYREANVQWRPVRPQDARYLLTFMIHAAQTVSQPKFGEIWMKTPFRTTDLPNGKKPIAEADRLTMEEYNSYPADEKRIYDTEALKGGNYYNKAHRRKILEMYHHKKMRLGVTGGGGLGGGSTIGINHARFIPLAWSRSDVAAMAVNDGAISLPENSGNNEMLKTAWNIFGHECGHALGFGHNSTYCVMGTYSHITVGTLVQSWLSHNNKLLVTSDTMVGRDPLWEGEFEKLSRSPQRSRPDLCIAYEWAGPYGRHNLVHPTKGTPEWKQYLKAHEAGKGFEFIKNTPVNQMLPKAIGKMNDRQWAEFLAAHKENRGMEYLIQMEQGKAPVQPETGRKPAKGRKHPRQKNKTPDTQPS